MDTARRWLQRQRRALDSRCYSPGTGVCLKQLGRRHLLERECILCTTKPICEVNRTASSPGSYVAALSLCAGEQRRFLRWPGALRCCVCPCSVHLGVAELEGQTSLKEPRPSRFQRLGLRAHRERPATSTYHGSLSPVIQLGMSLLREFRGVSERRWSFQRPLWRCWHLMRLQVLAHCWHRALSPDLCDLRSGEVFSVVCAGSGLVVPATETASA